jgi:predicted O-methyltransferase YrrM
MMVLSFGLAPLPAYAQDPTTEEKPAQQTTTQEALDTKVRSFLESHRRAWRDLNVPQADGQRLHDLVVEHGYKQALEIGTSTGHSAIWIAWGLSKTGGKLITVEIDERRYNQALAYFAEAGLSEYIDARLADAHELVPQLEGPFDFVFIDADKDWYTRYFQAVHPKVTVGGCITAHNVAGRRTGWVAEFLSALENTPNLETEILGGGNSGLSVSYKRGETGR